MVLKSITMLPGRIPSSTPPFPSTTSYCRRDGEAEADDVRPLS